MNTPIITLYDESRLTSARNPPPLLVCPPMVCSAVEKTYTLVRYAQKETLQSGCKWLSLLGICMKLIWKFLFQTLKWFHNFYTTVCATCYNRETWVSDFGVSRLPAALHLSERRLNNYEHPFLLTSFNVGRFNAIISTMKWKILDECTVKFKVLIHKVR